MENPTESQIILIKLRDKIADLMISGNFKVISAYLHHTGSVIYDIDVDGICLSIPINGNNINFYDRVDNLFPNLSTSDVKLVIDFILKGGIKCAIDSLKYQMETNKTTLDSLLQLYNSKQ